MGQVQSSPGSGEPTPPSPRSPTSEANVGDSAKAEAGSSTDVLVQSGAEIWRTPAGTALSAFVVAGAVGALATEGLQWFAVATAVVGGTHLACLFVPYDSPHLFRGLSAATLTTTALALFPMYPPLTPALFLGVSGLACLANMGRVAMHDPDQAKGALQLFIAVPALIGAVFSIDTTSPVYQFHPILMILGAATIAIGTSLQIGVRRNWTHSAFTGGGYLETVGAIAAILVVNGISLGSLHARLGLLAFAGLTVQVLVALPTLWPGLKPNERMCKDFHINLGRVNFYLLTAALASGLARSSGWGGVSTVTCLVVAGTTTVLITTPLWDDLQLAQISI